MEKILSKYSPFNQKELKAKVILINFLIIMKYMKEKGVIKKNGKFPEVEYRHTGRSNYLGYFVTALRKLLKDFFPSMDVAKQRSRAGSDALEFKIFGPNKKLSYDSKYPESFSSKLALAETAGRLANYNYNRFNQQFNITRRSSDFHCTYTYNEQSGTNYSPIEFFETQATELGVPNLVEENILQASVLQSLSFIHSKFLANPQDYSSGYINADNVQGALNELNRIVEQDMNYSEETRALLVSKILELRNFTDGMADSQLYELAKLHLSTEEDINNISYNDIHDDIVAA